MQGYHVQVTARSDRDLTPEGIIQKVADASGSKYSAGSAPPPVANATKPPIASKPAFTPTQRSGASPGVGIPSRDRPSVAKSKNVDEDGWGEDAPPVTRTQLEKVQSAYQPTKINMQEFTGQKSDSSAYNDYIGPNDTASDAVKGGYQPVGKVNIAEIRRQAKESGNIKDDRPEIVKGAYEPVGKVDIAAIRAKAQKPSDAPFSPPSSISPAPTGGSGGSRDEPRSMTDRSAAFSTSERLTTLPKPKVANKFGGGSTFTGTTAPSPGGFEPKSVTSAAPVGTASRTFADQGGKTPAQIWAEKKARERGVSGTGTNIPSSNFGGPHSPIQSQTSGGGEWKSGYTGKTWAPVQTTHTGRSSLGQQRTGDVEAQDEDASASPAGGVSSIRDRFSGAPPMGAPAQGFDRSSEPALDTSTKPNRGQGIPIPGFPRQPTEEQVPVVPLPSPPPQPRSPTPPTPEMRSTSPIRVAMPVSRGAETELADARDEQTSLPPVMPVRSMNQNVPEDEDDEPAPDPARGVAQAVAAASLGQTAVETAQPGSEASGKKALVQYDYAADESNEINLQEGEYVANIEMVDADWWMGQNEKGETGLFPSNYVELVEQKGAEPSETHEPSIATEPSAGGQTATAVYDYEAQEDNEISFPEGAKIASVVRTNLLLSLNSWHFHTNLTLRNFQTMIGGLENTEASKGSSLQITWNSISRTMLREQENASFLQEN